LNISVDTPDRSADFYQENLSYNDQESMVEIFIEKILGFQNTFEEYDDVDHEEESSVNHGSTFFIDDHRLNITGVEQMSDTQAPGFYYVFKKVLSPFQEIPSPPPDLV